MFERFIIFELEIAHLTNAFKHFRQFEFERFCNVANSTYRNKKKS